MSGMDHSHAAGGSQSMEMSGMNMQGMAHGTSGVQDEARAFVESVIPAQVALRNVADELETVVADDLWPLPKYRELLFQY